MFSRSQIVSCAAALVLAGAAWAQPPQGNPQNPQSGSPPQGSVPMGVPQSNMPGAPAPIAQNQIDPYVTDKDFVKNVAESSSTEVQLGKLAQDKASTDAVKDFGKKMVEVNTQTSQQVQKAADALKVPVSSDPPRRAKKAQDRLAKLSGADFDRAYLKLAADEQKQEVKQFERESKGGKAQGIKDFAAKNLPAEQERQKQAEELASGGAATAAAQPGK